jgi:hypothetical protein
VISRKEVQLAIGADGVAPIAVELYLVRPLRPIWNLGDQSTLHRLDELGFALWEGRELLFGGGLHGLYLRRRLASPVLGASVL